MVGVQLTKANCNIVQKRLSHTIKSWKSGKFMTLILRPWSLNSYAMSKIWFRCGSVDLRVGDITALNSSIKSWLYADLLEKPAEYIMCRPSSHRGLGVTSIKYKAQAILIKTFLETSAIPTFRHSLYHSLLFRFIVLDDSSIPDPGYPPYYPASFFQII